MVLVDSNVLLDIVTDDPRWSSWSTRQLELVTGSARINAVVYAEISVRFETAAAVDALLAQAGIELRDIPRDALFLAGKAFRQYRRAGGTRTGVLPDFFIGAHAAISQLPLLTRDPRRYRSYVPTAELIAP